MCCPFMFIWGLSEFKVFIFFLEEYEVLMLLCVLLRQEMERKRLEEWETQRKNELVQHRQREQEKVLELKAKQEHLNSKLEDMVSDTFG